MALPEHVASAKLVTIRRLRRQRGIAYRRGHIDAGLALDKRLRALGSVNNWQCEVAECLRKSGDPSEPHSSA